MLTAVTAPASLSLTTLEAALDELGVDDGASNGRITRLIAQASAACAGWVGRSLGRGRWMQTFDAPMQPLLLARLPVVAVISVASGGQDIDPAMCQVDAEAGALTLPPGWGGASWGVCGPHVSITYDAGYLMPDQQGATLPADIERACLETVRALWFSTGPNARDPSMRSESIDGIKTTSWLDPQAASGGLPAIAVTLLAPYKRYSA